MSYLFPARTITLDAALRDVARAKPKARVLAAHALGNLEDPTERRRAIEALIAALDDNEGEVRAEACNSLAAIGEGDSAAAIVAAITKRLDDGAAGVRQNAAIALGTLHHPDGFEPLAEALRAGPADLRYQAVTSLAEIDSARAYEPALAALGDGDPQVVAAAALTLGGIGDKRAVDAIAGKLETTDTSARFDIAYALAELGDARGRPALTAALDDIDRAWDAVSALGWLGAPEDVAALARSMPARKTPIEASVLAAGLLLALPGAAAHTDAARKMLLDALGNRRTHIRGIAVEHLGAAGGEWAIASLDKLARSGKGDELREPIAAAIRAIKARAQHDAR